MKWNFFLTSLFIFLLKKKRASIDENNFLWLSWLGRRFGSQWGGGLNISASSSKKDNRFGMHKLNVNVLLLQIVAVIISLRIYEWTKWTKFHESSEPWIQLVFADLWKKKIRKKKNNSLQIKKAIDNVKEVTQWKNKKNLEGW